MAELVDAHVSGTCGIPMQVQVLFGAPDKKPRTGTPVLYSFFISFNYYEYKSKIVYNS